MNLINKNVKYVSEESVTIPFEGKVKCYVKEGEFFSRGKVLFTTERRRVIESYFLPKELGVNLANLEDYVCRIDGEYITKGEMVAERLVSGGLAAKKVVSTVDGIIDFSRLGIGYIDILSELESDDFISKFSGQVLNVNMGKGLTVMTDVCSIPLFHINEFVKQKYLTESKYFTGVFDIVGSGQSISSLKNLSDSYEDKILFVGRFVYPDMVNELFSRGCKFILVGSMDYQDFRGLNLPVGIISGFGNIYFDEILLMVFQEFRNTDVLVDVHTQQLKFMVGLNSKIAKLFKSDFYAHIKQGDIVKSIDVDSFGLVGEVVSIEDDGNYASVLMQDGSTFLIHIQNLEIYKEDFTTMGIGIT